ncbi:MAG TPA: beta-1,6-N-acetylglucosaminyltransferase, partial [Acetobacteraceae bacterium]
MDAKTDLATLAEAALRLPAHARLVAPRIPVFWGGWSMMRATLALIEAALAEADYERLVLLSGDSLPVRDADAIEATLLESEAEFIDMMEVPDDSSLAGVAPEAAVASHGWVQPWR